MQLESWGPWGFPIEGISWYSSVWWVQATFSYFPRIWTSWCHQVHIGQVRCHWNCEDREAFTQGVSVDIRQFSGVQTAISYFLRIWTSWCHQVYIGQVRCRWNREDREAFTQGISVDIRQFSGVQATFSYFLRIWNSWCHQVYIGQVSAVGIARIVKLSHRGSRLIFVNLVGCRQHFHIS